MQFGRGLFQFGVASKQRWHVRVYFERLDTVCQLLSGEFRETAARKEVRDLRIRTGLAHGHPCNTGHQFLLCRDPTKRKFTLDHSSATCSVTTYHRKGSITTYEFRNAERSLGRHAAGHSRTVPSPRLLHHRVPPGQQWWSIRFADRHRLPSAAPPRTGWPNPRPLG